MFECRHIPPSTRARPEQAGGGHQDTANGELETKTDTATNDEWIFGYDVLGNLLSVGLPNGDLVEYLVDGAGRRVAKKLNGVVTKQWIYRDALKPVAELDGTGNLVAQFVYGSKSNVPDYVRRGGNTYRVVSDHLGSPRYVVNVANASDVPFTASYAAFGSVMGTGLDWMPFGFAGGIYDADSGLVRFGARDYDPMVGRWTSKDPIRFAGSRNFYAYSKSDPVNWADRTGLGPLPNEGAGGTSGEGGSEGAGGGFSEPGYPELTSPECVEACGAEFDTFVTGCGFGLGGGMWTGFCWAPCEGTGPLFGQCMGACMANALLASSACSMAAVGDFIGCVNQCPVSHQTCE